MRRNALSRRITTGILLTGLALLAAACGVKDTTKVKPREIRPALDATADQLVERYNQQARAVRALNAAVELNPVAGSTYSGIIEDYRDVRGFILAQRPANIRVIGQAPVVGKNIFDMVSDGDTFRIWIPSKNKFVVGPAQLERREEKPIHNVRPQHLLQALFWPEIRDARRVLFEEYEAQPERYYILTIVRDSGALEIARRVWFDRADLGVARMQVYEPGGRLVADVAYSDWQPASDVRFPRRINVRRPHDDYALGIRVNKLTLNEDVAADRFRLDQPPGAELVRVGERTAEKRP